MFNLLQHFGLFITTYRAGIYFVPSLVQVGSVTNRIAISMLPGGRDVFFFMIAAGGTGEKFLSFGSTGWSGYDLFLVGVARGRNYVHFFIAAYRTGGNFLSILCAGRCCDYRCAIAVITGGSQHFNLLIAAYTAGCDFLPFLSAGRLRDYLGLP